MGRAALVAVAMAAACAPPKAPTADGRRIVVFRADGFPTIDAPVIDDTTLDQALAGLPVERSADLSRLNTHDLLVLPYGSAFPIDGWPRIRAFLEGGGHLVVFGGAPFHEPIHKGPDGWVRGARQPAFAHDLAIGPAEPIAVAGFRSIDVPGFTFGPSAPKTTWALTLRLADTKTFPDEHGSEGPRTGLARPLAHVVDDRGVPRGCPLLEIERPTSRWIFATTDAPLGPRLMRAIVERARMPPAPAKLTIDRVVVDPGANVAIHGGPWNMLDENGVVVARGTGNATAPRSAGRYTVVAGAARNAFWVRDDRLRRGPALTVSRDWLRRDGHPFPVVGTTYMASDAHRQFLFEPNPDVWERDFAAMEKSGVRFVRTGLWTAWSRAAKDGAVDPAVLDALEAFVLTAQRHDIVVCFNFFAFLPPWGFDHPYLDPRALAAQKRFVRAFAARFAKSPWIHWDLINEPSYAPREKLWQTRAIGGPLERDAFRVWAAKRHGTTELRSLWHEPGDVFAPPRDVDFDQTAVMVQKRPRKTRDFRELVEDVVAHWADELRNAIHEAGGGLVTLGQDEGGLYERPTQAFLADGLDYTAVHTWWKNDDLLWDGVLTKTVGRPNLHQETGLMRLEDLDGRPWRRPEDAAALLERKIGYAFAARGAGVVEWVWNVNPYMPLDEESTIGLVRPDGTVKPERDVLERFARFFAEIAPQLDDFDPEPVVLVVPHARAFLGRVGALDATKEVVRVLAEHYGIVPAAVSDLRVTELPPAKLVVVPMPEVLDETAALALLRAARRGTKVLVTGAIEGDSYGRATPSLQALGLLGPSRPVAMLEKSPWGNVAFHALAQETVRRAENTLSFDGDIWHEPLPLERSRDREPLVKLLGTALARAGVAVSPDEGGVVGHVLTTATRALVVCVNERPSPAKRKLVVDGRSIELDVRAGGVRLVLLDRKSGRVEASYD